MDYEQPDKPYELLIEQDRAEEEQLAKVAFEAERALARKLGDREAEAKVKEVEEAARQMLTRPLTDFTPSNMQWLWDQRIPIGEITMVAGKAGIGKSTFLCTLAAWLSVGKMRGKYQGTPRDVIYIPNEDSIEKGLMPRMMAADADLSRIHIPFIRGGDESELPIILPEDCARLGAAARQSGAVAVIIDPLSSNMSDKDRNRPEVRQSYERLRRCADDYDLAIIGNGHLRKGQSKDILEGLLGSSEIGNIVRAAIGIVPDPDSEEFQMVVGQAKNNYGPMDLRSYVYRIQPREMWTDSGAIRGTFLDWQESTDRQVNDLQEESMTFDGSKTDIAEAVEWLRDYLSSNGTTPRKDVASAGAKEGIKDHTLKKAARKLHVIYATSGFPRVTSWSLPSVSTSGNPGSD